MYFTVTWTSPDLRPLGEISLIRDPSVLVSANCVIDIWTPGHVGKHVKQVCKLLWWQGIVLVLKHTNVGLDRFSHSPKHKEICLGSYLALLWLSRMNSTTVPVVHIRSSDSFHWRKDALGASCHSLSLPFFLISRLNLLSIPHHWQDVKTTQQAISVDLCNVCCFELLWGRGWNKHSGRWTGFYLVVFVKDALEKEVGSVVELCGGVWRNFQPAQKDGLYSGYPSTPAWKSHRARRLTGERGSPGLAPGHRHNQTSSAPSRWFHGALAGWTGCGGRGSLHKHTTHAAVVFLHTHSGFMMPEDGSCPHTPTFERESVVTHAFAQILPHHVFHIFQCTRFQWGVEARPLRTSRQNITTVRMTQKALTFPWPFHRRQMSAHLEKVELIIVEYPVIVQVWHFEDSSQGFYTKGFHLAERKQRSRVTRG